MTDTHATADAAATTLQREKSVLADLSVEEVARYRRQIVLAKWGPHAQKTVKGARVAIIGIGGLGTMAATYLATSGVGHLTLIDADRVEASNLQRQPLYAIDDIGKNKVEVAAHRLAAMNAWLTISTHTVAFSDENAASLLQDVDLVLDCSDNFQTRDCVNRWAKRCTIPLVSAAVVQFEGQLASFDFRHPESPCYRCLFPHAANDAQDVEGEQVATTCSALGIMAPVAGIFGTMQALEALKLLAGKPTLEATLLLWDLYTWRMRQVRYVKDAHCPVCAKG